MCWGGEGIGEPRNLEHRLNIVLNNKVQNDRRVKQKIEKKRKYKTAKVRNNKTCKTTKVLNNENTKQRK